MKDRTMQTSLKLVLSALTILALAACNGLAVPPRPVALYDLGLTEPLDLPAGRAPAQILLNAPSWLNSSAMQYKLEWDQSSRRRTFLESRWVANPLELLSRSLDRAILGATTGTNQCRMRVELDEFIQIFDSADSGRAELIARASWLPARGDRILATREFRLSKPTVAATAERGVEALKDLSSELARGIAGWLDELDRNSPQGLNASAACRN